MAGTAAAENEVKMSNIEKKDNMLKHLLLLLNSAVSMGFGPNPDAFGSVEEQDIKKR